MKAVERPTPRERSLYGKSLRETTPLASHAELTNNGDRPNPVHLLAEQAADRVPELVPVRYGRMLASPFAFYRGAARVMAADLSRTPASGLTCQVCGDAHLSNFGLFGSPERHLVFDLNDFDETTVGPWEWDVKRLAASLAIAGRENGYSAKQRRTIVLTAVARYRTALAEFAAMRDLEVWYAHLDAEELLTRLSAAMDAKRRKRIDKYLARAKSRDSVQAMGKLTTDVNGEVRIMAAPPLVVPIRDLMSFDDNEDLAQRFRQLIRQYRATLQTDRRALLERYHFVDMARKVVGVGSVGTRCWIVLLIGRTTEDPLFLQIKEANASVLAEYLHTTDRGNQGRRVVTGQRLMQQASDIFLGWQRTAGIDGVERDFYVRQLRDWKGSITIEELQPKGMALYAELCGWSLARAHARSGDRIAISGYLGSSATFDNAIADFAEAYADVNERDHKGLVDAVAAGELPAQTGV